METVIIPEYSDLKKQITQCVDRFSEYTLSISLVLKQENSGNSVVPRLNNIKDKIFKKSDVKNNGVFRLLVHFIEELETSINDIGTFSRDFLNTKSKKKFGIQPPAKEKLTTPETLDRLFKKELKEEIDKIEKIKRKHDILIEDLIKRQKKIWEIKAEINKTPSPGSKLLKHLHTSKQEYLKLVEKEVNLSDELIKETDIIEMKVMDRITTNLTESFDRLRMLVNDFIPNEMAGNMLRKFDDVEINAIAGEIYQSSCKYYRYAEPAEYFKQLSFDEYLLETPETKRPRKLNINLDGTCMLDDKNEAESQFIFSDDYQFSGQQKFSYQAQFVDKKRSKKKSRIREFFRKKFGIKEKFQKKSKSSRDIIAEHRILTLIAACFLENLLGCYRNTYLEDLYCYYMKLLPEFAKKE